MPRPEESTSITCPICFETFEIVVDLSAGSRQSFVYDCEICCHPIQVKLTISKKGAIKVESDYAN